MSRDLDRASSADATEIVTRDVHDHRQFGLILFASRQRGPKGAVLFWVASSGPRSFDWAGMDPAAMYANKQFRAHRKHRAFRSGAHHRPLRGRANGAQAEIKRPDRRGWQGG